MPIMVLSKSDDQQGDRKRGYNTRNVNKLVIPY